MSDLISRRAILENIEKTRQGVQMMDDTHRASIIMNGMYLCEKAVRNQPSAEKKGKWIICDNQRQEDINNGNYMYTCTNCLHSDVHAKTQKVPYCWWCGAKME